MGIERMPLPPGHLVVMGNGGIYKIRHLIAAGGYSLVYSAETEGGKTSVIIKEFFPSSGAVRHSDGCVRPLVGSEKNFEKNLLRFERECDIGGEIADVCFQTISAWESSGGYAVMKRESDDMRSFADLISSWEQKGPLPYTGNLADRDPVFPDLVRVRYSLRMTESLLRALLSMHNMGYLHLDLSSSNVIWAGREVETGAGCTAFLADFGCTEKMISGEYHNYGGMSYSPGFASPEIMKEGSTIKPASDLYSVGMLLFNLCVGKNALHKTISRKRQIKRETEYLEIPKSLCSELQRILTKALDKQADLRYGSAEEMLDDIVGLKNLIPRHPINPDNSSDFTLYTLKSMLTGSRDICYSWADELCDRQGKERKKFSETVYDGLTGLDFKDDNEFLRSVLPDYLYNYLSKKINEEPDRERALSKVLSGNYEPSWKKEIIDRIRNYSAGGDQSFLHCIECLEQDEGTFHEYREILFDIIDDQRLKNCYYNCAGDIYNNSSVGLTLFTVRALLGQDGFTRLLPSQDDAVKYFHC